MTDVAKDKVKMTILSVSLLLSFLVFWLGPYQKIQQLQIMSMQQQTIEQGLAQYSFTKKKQLQQQLTDYQNQAEQVIKFESMATIIHKISETLATSNIKMLAVKPIEQNNQLQVAFELQGTYLNLLQWLENITHHKMNLTLRNWKFNEAKQKNQALLNLTFVVNPTLKANNNRQNRQPNVLQDLKTSFVPTKLLGATNRSNKNAKQQPYSINFDSTWQFIGVIGFAKKYRAVLEDDAGNAINVKQGDTFDNNRLVVKRITARAITIAEVANAKNEWQLFLQD